MITYEFFMNHLGISKQRAESLYNQIKESSVSNILTYNENVLIQKFDFYKQIGFSIREFEKFPQLLAFDCVSNAPTSAKYKLDFYHSLGFSNSALKSLPNLLGYDCVVGDNNSNSVCAKIDFYVNEVGIKFSTLQKYPKLLSLDITSDSPTSVKSKLKFYEEELGFTSKEINIHPNLLNYDIISTEPTSVKSKLKFFEKYLGLNPRDLKSQPSLLGANCDTNAENKSSILFKIKEFNDIGFDNEFIKKHLIVLTMPAEDIKNKYALWCTIFPDKRFSKNSGTRWYIPSTEKVYARYMYFKNERNGRNLIPYNLEMSEKKFNDLTHENSADLVQRYPYDEEAKRQIIKNYEDMKIEPPLKFND